MAEEIKFSADGGVSYEIFDNAKPVASGGLKNFYYGAPIIQKPVPKKVIYNNLTTIVVWDDNTKTVVKCSDGDNFHEDLGFMAAVVKKIYGHRNTYMKHVKNAYRQDDTKKSK